MMELMVGIAAASLDIRQVRWSFILCLLILIALSSFDIIEQKNSFQRDYRFVFHMYTVMRPPCPTNFSSTFHVYRHATHESKNSVDGKWRHRHLCLLMVDSGHAKSFVANIHRVYCCSDLFNCCTLAQRFQNPICAVHHHWIFSHLPVP